MPLFFTIYNFWGLKDKSEQSCILMCAPACTLLYYIVWLKYMRSHSRWIVDKGKNNSLFKEL